MSGDDLSPLGRPLTIRDRIGFGAMIVGMFMAILDIQIVASSLGEIQGGLSASREEISWVQTGYLIAEVIMIPLSGWLAQAVSTRLLFFVSALTFTIASALCAMAWNLDSMVIFRAMQGFLGGAMIPTVFATAYAMFPAKSQAKVGVVIGLVATTAPTLGPTLGGWLTDTFSWHWLFLINVIPGLIVSTIVFFFVDVDKPDLKLFKHFDTAGIALIAVFLGSLQFILEEGPGDDWFDSQKITLFTAITVLAGIGFFWRELTAKSPVVNLRAFKNPNFALGCFYSFIIGIGLYGSVYVLPLFLGQIKGYNALQIGSMIMVTGAFQFLSAPLAGALSSRIDGRAMLAVGLACFGLGLWLNATLTAEWGYWEFFLPQAVRGISLMFLFIPVNALALGRLSPEMLKGGSSLYNLMRNLGGAIGLAAISTIISDRYDLHRTYLAESITAARPPVQEALAGITSMLQPSLGVDAATGALARLNGLVAREAMVMAFSDVLVVMALVFVFGLLFMPLMRPVEEGAAGGGH